MPILRPGLVFVHIPKCAGTSIEVAAGFDAQYPQLGLAPVAAAADAQRLFGGGLEHLSMREIRTQYAHLFDEPPRSFTIVRDPVDRFVSHFVWRFYRFNTSPPPLEEMLAQLRSFTLEVGRIASVHPLFRDPHQGIVYDGTPDSIHPNDIFRHLVPQCAFVFDRGEIAVDRIYPMSAMARVAEMLHREYGFAQTLPRRMIGPASRELRGHLPADIERAVRALYTADAQFLTTVRT